MRIFKQFVSLFCTLSLIFCLSGYVYAVQFSESDLQGEWNVQTLGDGAWEGWTYGNMTINSNGEFDLTVNTSEGNTNYSSGAVEIKNDGRIEGVNKDIHGVMTSDKNFITLLISANGENHIAVAVKKGGSFSETDLEGEWATHALVLGSWEGWAYGTLDSDANGNYNVNANYSDGSTYNWSGNLNITGEGIITDSQDESVHGVMTPDKNVIITTFTDGGEYVFTILTKKGSGFDQADLEGDWHFGAKAAGQWSGYFYGDSIIDSNGNINQSWTTSGGDEGSAEYSISINDNGVIPGDTYHGSMTSDKNMFVEVYTSSDSGNRYLAIQTLDTYTEDDNGGGGGGGCVMTPNGFFGFSWLLLLMIPAFMFVRRRL